MFKLTMKYLINYKKIKIKIIIILNFLKKIYLK